MSESEEIDGLLFVPQMRLETAQATIQFTEPEFANLILEESENTKARETVSQLYELFRTAGTGKFTRPRHHSYQIPFYDPKHKPTDYSNFGGSFVHWSCGSRFPGILILWVFVWLIGVAVHALRDRITMC